MTPVRTARVDKSRELVGLRQMLDDPEAQVRLNAAVRLAYLGCPDGLAQLVEGLSHPELAIAMVQVPEALAVLGETAWQRLVSFGMRRAGPGWLWPGPWSMLGS